MSARFVESVRGDIDTGDLPSLLCTPDGVRPFAAPNVDGATRRQPGGLSDKHGIRVAAPRETRGGIAIFPKLSPERCSSVPISASPIVRDGSQRTLRPCPLYCR